MTEIVEPRAVVAEAAVVARPRRLGAEWRSPIALAGAGIIVLWTLVAVFAGVIAPHDPLAQTAAPFLAPSGAHWFGTDDVGRDVFSRVLYGARVSPPLGVAVVAAGCLIGSVAGALAGYHGGVVDTVVMRLSDLVFAFPNVVLAMVITAAIGPSLTHAALAIVVVSWPSYARVVRSMVLAAREADYVKSARLLGIPWRTVLRRDVAPNVMGPVLVLATVEIGNAILLLAGLSFLGLGAHPPTAEWGSMVATGAQTFDRWWVGTFAGLAIMSIVLAFNFVGDTLRDVLDPQAASQQEGTRA
jgi:ABC-type dipeptide/oligopeptide/nickel transport system permease subunit